MPFQHLPPVPLEHLLAVVALFAALFAVPFSAALHELRPKQKALVAVRAGRRIRRAGSVNILAFPLVGSLVGVLSAEGEERRVWWSRMWIQAAVMAGLPLLFWWDFSAVMSGAPVMDCLGRFLVHAVLFLFLLAASAVDWLDQLASDALTVHVAQVGVILVALFPISLLNGAAAGATGFAPVYFYSPGREPSWSKTGTGLLAAFLGFGLWYAAVLHRDNWRLHGLKGLWLRLCAMKRRAMSWDMLMGSTVGSVMIALVWVNGGSSWVAMLSSILGAATGIAIGWFTRIFFSALFRKEAFGFGDVLYLGAIGAFVGWQGVLFAFMLHPFCALPILVVEHMTGSRSDRRAAIPYLSTAAIVTCICWSLIWPKIQTYLWLIGLG